jgi:hypothetical protein
MAHLAADPEICGKPVQPCPVPAEMQGHIDVGTHMVGQMPDLGVAGMAPGHVIDLFHIQGPAIAIGRGGFIQNI